ncbi:hypothetical protein Agub_g7875, partial [Astrephomene gubernaculifera]
VHRNLDYQDVLASMKVCKAFHEALPNAVEDIRVEKAITQATLQYLCCTFHNLKNLTIHPEYDDHNPRLDFSNLHFPVLQSLEVANTPVTTLVFTSNNTPKLQRLSIEQQTSPLRSFRLDLPELETLSLEHLTVHDCSDFAPSLAACPKLRTFVSYKFWGPDDDVYDLRLPECEDLSLTRCDGLGGLRLWAPKLTSLDLQGCFGLRKLQLLDVDPRSQQQQPQERQEERQQQEEQQADNTSAG